MKKMSPETGELADKIYSPEARRREPNEKITEEKRYNNTQCKT